ncbi:MAG TPA: hypothetical protein VM513_03705 [Kofleriaceae bacterium]|nr:hypothetical protein [Kofleriaceae bacterium]
MKKIALAFASLCIAATPVLACPHMDKAETETEAPRTAEKKKEEAPKTDKAKDTKTAKPAEKAPTQKPDKVSQK